MKKIDFSNRDLEKKILSILPQFGYTGIEKPNGVWLENSLNTPAFEFVRITASNIDDAESILESYQNEYSGLKEYIIEYSRCLKLLSRLVSGISPETVEFFKRGITFCPRLKLTQLFKEGIAPIFFGTFAGGEIIVAKTTLTYWSRAALQRSLYVSSHYPDVITSREITSFESLSRWNRLEADDFLSIILGIVQHLFFPYVSCFITGHGVGLKVIFIPPQSFEHSRPLFPADWLDFLRADTELAEESRTSLGTAEELFIKPKRSIYGKYVFTDPPLVNDTIDLVEWAICSANALVTRLYDVTNFTVADSDEIIDPVYGQEYAHSIMHVLRDAASIIAEDSRYRNKATTFRIADILSALAEQGSLKKPPDEFFREVFRCDIGKPRIKNILDGTGIAALRLFANTTDEIYENLKRTLLDSIYIPTKRKSDGVSVRSAALNSERIMSEDKFCGQVLRTLRNTQHGYLTRGDRSSRPSRFLSLVDGNTLDDFPTLGVA